MILLNSMSRRRFARFSMLAGFACAHTLALAQTRPEKPRLVIAVDGKHALTCLPLVIADQLGYFRAEGLDVQIRDHADAAAASQALLSGTADVCSGPFERTLFMQARGRMLKAFVLQGRAPQIAFGVSTRSLPGYAAITDLRGKKLGIMAVDSTSSLIVQLLLKRGGLGGKDVTLSPSGSWVNALNALRSGQIDALANTDPVITLLEQKGEIKIVSDTRTLKGAADLFGGIMPSACLFAPIEFVQKNPETCQSLANAIVHSLKWLQTAGPGDMIKTMPESYLLGDRSLYLAGFNKIRQSLSTDGLMPDEGPEIALKALVEADPVLRLAKINTAKTYTNEFVRRAKTRFKL